MPPALTREAAAPRARRRVTAWRAALLALLLAAPGGAQATDAPLTLEKALEMARTQSPSALTAIHRFRGSYWQYVTFKADYRPSLDLESEPLEWERTIDLQTLPDGTDAFVERSQMNSAADLSLSKVISFTAGRLSLRTGLARTEALEGLDGVAWYSTPVSIGFDQPLFAYNDYKWGLRIEPKRFAEARQQLVEDFEMVAATTISYFFDLLSAQSTLADVTQEHAHAETLLAATRRRFAEGRAREDDVLQAELAGLNADLRLTRVRVDVKTRQQRLGTHLGVGEDPDFVLAPALGVPRATVDLATAIAEARRNRPWAMSWDRQLLEADRSVAEARNSRGSIWLRGRYGLSRSTDEWSELFRDTRTDQTARISIRMPILDWGRSGARVAMAESQREVIRRNVEQARADFERDVFLRVSQFEIQSRQLELSSRADSVASRRYELTRQRYLRGELDLTAVDVAQREKDAARRGSLDVLRSYWAAYYDVRRATLYDFERRVRLAAPEAGIARL